MRRIARLLALAGALVLVAVLGLVLSNTPGSPVSPDASSGSTAAPASAVQGTAPAGPDVQNNSGLETVAASALPPEARSTLALIARGGPYPYPRDGAVFSNFERLLPRKPAGYYKEFTVRTPGEPDRGARRIVVGVSGEKYYTPDHYESFLLILEGK
ncbi:guanine-specific ribonuclease N1 and T1 [Arthrobacter sp. FB24]|uniref:ribonuclease domain-containing protein n=1 Tax=Arthrobacter sp. (strain FB24) TaxID=290399 RepID=UPI0000527958|nr:ribonuclease domain-containing protein [Arthrobacter sp. FB24]ABK02132.1 guanine-specific ribonuclease N1 and T1 [Arthrobacter sp. FB24]